MIYKPHHTAISVRDLSKSLKFYETLGYEQVHRYSESDGSMSIVHLKLGESYLEVFCYAKNQKQPKLEYQYANNLEEVGVKHIALKTDDVTAALADLKAKGLADDATKIDVSDTGKASWFFVQDPDGVWVEIIKDDRYK